MKHKINPKEPSGDGWVRHYGVYPNNCPDGACAFHHAGSGLLVMSDVIKKGDKCSYYLSVTKLSPDKVQLREAMHVADVFGLKNANHQPSLYRNGFERIISQDVEE